MRLPAVAIACAFAFGIAIGLWPGVAQHESSSAFLRAALLSAVLLIMAVAFLSARNRLYSASILSLSTWIVLGACGAAISNQPKPNNYILNLIDGGKIDLHTPLRWHGVLRDEPTALPWGTAYDINLTGVDFEERLIPIDGGLRVSYSPHGPDAALPDVHAGDEVAVVTQARLPQLFRDEGAFDRREYLRSQGVDLTATLRSSELLERIVTANNSPHTALARLRRRLRENLAAVLPNSPDEAAVLRAMLLGDRSFLDRSESVNFQKTGVFHVLVVAGLHVGAFAAFLFWLARRMRLSRFWTSLTVILCVTCYVAVVEQRPPVIRAALMTFVVVLALLFFRRVELLNSVAVAALILLLASPSLLADSSFQLSFLSMFCIAALALPWLEQTIEPFTRGMRGWRDVTRDVSHPPRRGPIPYRPAFRRHLVRGKVPGAFAHALPAAPLGDCTGLSRRRDDCPHAGLANRYVAVASPRFSPRYAFWTTRKSVCRSSDGNSRSAWFCHSGSLDLLAWTRPRFSRCHCAG